MKFLNNQFHLCTASIFEITLSMIRNISLQTILTVLGAGFMLSAQAQPELLPSPASYSHVKQKNGLWTFYRYPNQIISATFIPINSERDEQISDAVIAKRLQQRPLVKKQAGAITLQWPDASLKVTDSSIFFTLANRQDLILTNASYSDSLRGLHFRLEESEKIFGTGSRSLPLNRRGYSLPLHNNPWYGYSLNADALNYSVPVIMSSRGYALFIDNPSSGRLDIGKTNPDMLSYTTGSGRLSFYLIPGKNYSEILSRLHALVGTQTMPPRWAMGHFMSRFGYTSEVQVQGILQEMEKNEIPVDAIILDLFWFGDSIKQTMGNLEWVNKKAWPDPEKMIRGWKKKDIHTILITEPFVVKQSANYEPSKNYHARNADGMPYVLNDFYFGEGGLIDIFRKDASDWFYGKYKKQMDIGVSGWWGDLGEPEKHPSDMLHDLTSQGYYRKFSAPEIHNMYGHTWSKMLYERFRKDYPRRRLFHLNRSGYVGTPRFGSFPWSGDVSRSWEGLQGQIPLMLGMSMSGVPYMHSDAGGFAGGEGDGELYTRWMQFAAFTPIFRPHGTALGVIEPSVKDIPSEAALWPEPYRGLAKKAILERYKWLPYNYTLSYEQHVSGKPLVSPVFFLQPADSNLYKAEDQYLWGEQVMVVPVTGKGQREKKMYIPEGSWTNIHNQHRETGRRWVTQEVQPDAIPVWVKEGSFIPTVTDIRNASDYANGKLTVTYYPSTKPGLYTLYEDDGENAQAIREKQFELTKFHSSGIKNNRLRITVSSNNGRYPGRKANRAITLAIPQTGKPVSVTVNGKTLAIKDCWNDQRNEIQVTVSIGNRNQMIDIKL